MAINYNWHRELSEIEFTLNLENGQLILSDRTIFTLSIQRKCPYMYFEGYVINNERQIEINGETLTKICFTPQGIIYTTNNNNSYLDGRYRKFKRTSSRKDWILVVKNQPKISYCN